VKEDFNSKLNTLLHQERIAFATSPEIAKKKVIERIGKKSAVIPIQRNTNPIVKLAIAASVAVIAALSVFFFGNDTIKNDSGTVASHLLPDGSEVFLRPNSSISYNSLLWGLDRSVELDGIGFFEVKKGEKFDVETNVGTVSVLGTSFSVSTFEEAIKVSCKTGKVQVENEEGFSAILTPGRGVKMNSKESFEFNQPKGIIDQWIRGSYRFDNVKVLEVFNAIEDFSDTEILFPADITSKYSGEFSSNQKIEDILDIVCKPLGLVYEIDEDDYLIRITKK